MRLPFWQLGGAVVAAFVLVASPAAAGPDDTPDDLSELSSEQRDQLESHVQNGEKAYEAGEFEESLRQFERAREILDHPDFVYRIALAHERLGNVREAIDAYREFLEMAPEAEERGKVERTIRELEERLESSRPRLQISTNPAGAKVFLDGASEPSGVTTIDIPVDPGEHEIQLRREGYRVAERTVEITRGETVSMQVDLEKSEPATSGGDPAAPAESSGPRIGPILALGAGGLFAAGSIVSYTQFARFRRDVRDDRECTPDCAKPDGFDRNADRQKTWEGVTWTLGSLAVATASAGAIWMAVGGEENADRSAGGPVIAPMVGADRLGLQLRFSPSGGR